MDDDAPGHRETGRATMSRLKGGLQPQLCNEAHDDNDTPAQSQPRRNMGTRNEGGSVRTTEGSDSRETEQLAVACVLPVSWGVVDK